VWGKGKAFKEATKKNSRQLWEVDGCFSTARVTRKAKRVLSRFADASGLWLQRLT